MVLCVRVVDAMYVHQTWPLVQSFLQMSMDRGEGPADYTMDHMQVYVTSGQWLLLVAVDEKFTIHGAATVSFTNYPLNRVAFITAVGGAMLIVQDVAKQLKAVLKQYGATKIQAYVRPSMERLTQRVGFSPGNRLIEVAL